MILNSEVIKHLVFTYFCYQTLAKPDLIGK
jgi:hypothetical protein